MRTLISHPRLEWPLDHIKLSTHFNRPVFCNSPQDINTANKYTIYTEHSSVFQQGSILVILDPLLPSPPTLPPSLPPFPPQPCSCCITFNIITRAALVAYSKFIFLNVPEHLACFRITLCRWKIRDKQRQKVYTKQSLSARISSVELHQFCFWFTQSAIFHRCLCVSQRWSSQRYFHFWFKLPKSCMHDRFAAWPVAWRAPFEDDQKKQFEPILLAILLNVTSSFSPCPSFSFSLLLHYPNRSLGIPKTAVHCEKCSIH